MSRREGVNRKLELLLCAVLLPFAVACLVYNACWLFAEGYDEYALDALSIPAPGADGLKAAEISTRLSPYAYDNRAHYAFLLTEHENTTEGLSQFHRALAEAPADPFLWQAYIYLKVSLGQFDADLDHALSRVNDLAPSTHALQFANAIMAVQYWAWADTDAHREWIKDIRFELAVDPRGYMLSVLAIRHEESLCNDTGFRNTLLDLWCPVIAQARKNCFRQPPLDKKTAYVCRHLGLVADIPQ